MSKRQAKYDEKIFSANDVKSLLCDACKVSIPDMRQDGKFVHHLNGVAIPCPANRWREIVYIELKESEDSSEK